MNTGRSEESLLEGLLELIALIRDDGYAMSFQSMGKYRSALLEAALKHAKAQIEKNQQLNLVKSCKSNGINP